VELPETHYARSGDLSIAYQVIGEGPSDLIYVPSGFLYTIVAVDVYGDASRDLGVKYVDGAQVAYYVFSPIDQTTRSLSGIAQVEEGRVIATFPMDELEYLGTPFRWRAYLDIDGKNVDLCPSKRRHSLSFGE
jgi:hypothetical protein